MNDPSRPPRARRARLRVALLMTALCFACWAAGSDTIRDAATGLDWTRADNGQDLDWKSARAHCAAKKSGWRLPTAEELEALYGTAAKAGDSAACGKDVCHVSPLFTLSGSWFWSSTHAGNEKDDGRDLFFGVLLVNGKRTADLAEFAYGSRALCVRR